MAKLETVKIKSGDGFIVINKKDLKKSDVLFVEKKKKSKSK